MQKRNEGSKKKKPVLAKKIGAIFSSACGTATTTFAGSRAFNMAFGNGGGGNVGERERENERERPISAALNKTHPCDEVQPHAADAKATNCLQLARRQRIVSSSLSEILASPGLRKWKSSLKKVARVKLRLKTMGNEGKAGKAEAKPELELCKKRILMGEKCRALNHSGVLHYDKQGILLPED